MAMHHHLPERFGRIEKLVPDPDQIDVVLGMKRHARPYASMHEKIIAPRHEKAEVTKEVEMRGRQIGHEGIPPSRGRRTGPVQAVYVDPVGRHGRLATVHTPMIEAPRIVQKRKQEIFVVAFEEIDGEALGQSV